MRTFIDFVVDDIGEVLQWDKALQQAVDLPRFERDATYQRCRNANANANA
ncbi:hypothetical protein [Pandoraea terrae]|nr:hypothetical protein [Pandoraea terrae]